MFFDKPPAIIIPVARELIKPDRKLIVPAISFISSGRFGGAAPATSITFITSTTSGGSTITAPATVNPGDLLVLWDVAVNVAGIPASVIPSGFTSISDFTDAATRRGVTSFKLCDGSEDSASLTIMNGTNNNTSVLAQFRGNNQITVATSGSPAGQFTAVDPTAQVITSGSGTPPLIVFGFYFQSLSVTARSFSTTEDATVPADSNNTANIKYKIYNSSPANTTVDEGDGGTNALASCYIQAH